MYSLDQRVVFDPFDLALDITPGQVRSVLGGGDCAQALTMALRLNEEALVHEVLQSIPADYGESNFLLKGSKLPIFVLWVPPMVSARSDCSQALTMALRLNEEAFVHEVLQTI